MTISLHGLGVSRGIAIGKVHIIERDQLDIPEYHLSEKQIETEIERLQQAVTGAKQQLRAIKTQIPAETSAEIAGFIDTHLLMLDDAVLIEEPEKLIRERRYNAEWAIKVQRDALVNVFARNGTALSVFPVELLLAISKPPHSASTVPAPAPPAAPSLRDRAPAAWLVAACAGSGC